MWYWAAGELASREFLNILKSWVVLAPRTHFGVCTWIVEDKASESSPMDTWTLTQPQPSPASPPPLSLLSSS